MYYKFLCILALILPLALISCKEHGKEDQANLLRSLEGANLYYDNEWIDFGNSAYREALVSGWSPDQKESDGTTFSEAFLKSATLRFNNYIPAEKVMTIRCRTIKGSASPQIFMPVINGKRLRWQKAKDQYQDFTFRIPQEYLHTGMNWIQFTFKSGDSEKTERKTGMAFDYITLLPKGSLESLQSLAKNQPRFQRIHLTKLNSSRTALVAPAESQTNLYCRIPKKDPVLHVKFALSDSAPRNSASRFEVTLQSDTGSKKKIFSAELQRSFFALPFFSGSGRIDLKEFADQVVELSIKSDAIAGKIAPNQVYWKEIAISDKDQQTAEKITKTEKPANLPNVFIYLIDALRPDHLQSYGYQKETSPRILEFARDSVVFENAYAQTSWTRASIASIQTGLYPTSHLVEDRSDTLPSFLASIPAELKKAGFQSHAFFTNGNISRFYNFQHNYTNYVWLGENRKVREIHQQSDKLHNRVKQFLESNPQQPYYLYVHSTDPHGPYTPEKGFLDVPSGCDMEDPALNHPALNYRKAKDYLKPEIDCVRALYDAEIRKNDHYFGQFLNVLEQLNLYDNSLIVLTADHGESFLEHGMWGHGLTLYQTEIRVPLIVHFPGSHPKGRVDIAARHIDIFPTILDLVNLKIPAGVQGHSLLSIAEGRRTEDVPAFSELSLDGRDKRALVLRQYKIIQNNSETPSKKTKPLYELYDLKSDPSEQVNLAADRPILLGYMKSLLLEWAHDQSKRKAALKKPKGAVLDRETEETLKALGYLQ